MLETEQLRAFSQLSSPLLTAYVDFNPLEPSNRGPSPQYISWLHSAGKSAAGSVPSSESNLFHAQCERVEGFLRDMISPPRSIVIFAGPNVWTHVPLPIEVENELHWGKPFLFPLLEIVTRHKPCAIVVMDYGGARFFRYAFGEMREIWGKRFEVDVSGWRKKDMGKVFRPGIAKSRGADQDSFERRVDAQYQRLCNEIAGRARELIAQQPLAELFVIGPNRLTGPVTAALPRDLQPRIVMFEEDMSHISLTALQEHIAPAVAERALVREWETVNALLDGSGGAVTGIDSTLAELQRGNVRLLVVAAGFDSSLRECTKCGWTDRLTGEACPACGASCKMVDSREVLPLLAWNHGAGIEVIGKEASVPLIGAGGIGALLRQPKQISAMHSAA